MIKINNLSKSYGDMPVLNNISLTINEGEIFGLVGRSGEGKSTLLRCINALESISDGEIFIDEIPVHTLDKKGLRELRKEVGMVFQDFSLINRATVFKNVAAPLECWNYDRVRIKERVNYLLDVVGLSDKSKVKANRLSGGQKQRVAIARALALKPKVLLSDEATSSLDPNSTNQIIDLMRDINAEFGITEVIVSHEMDVIRKLTTSVAILENRKIKDQGSTAEIFLRRPDSLVNLLGMEEDIVVTSEQNILRISFVEGVENVDFLSSLILELNVPINIDHVSIEKFNGQNIINNYISSRDEDKERIMAYCSNKSVEVSLVEKGAEVIG